MRSKLKPRPVILGLLLSLSSSFQPAYSRSLSSSAFADCVQYEGDVQAATRRWWPDIPFWTLWEAQIAAESRCNAAAVSAVGAAGLVQFMPTVATEWARRLSYDPMTSPHDAKFAIPAGAAFMASLRGQWNRGREPIERHWLAAAAYNRGISNVLKDQAECNDALLWRDISVCTAIHTHETIDYIDRIASFWHTLDASQGGRR